MKPIIFETAFQTYTAIDILGEGGAGMVYKATDDNSNYYAIKSLKKASTEKRKRFQNELSFGFKNRHRNIITISDYGLSKDEPFYVMPLFDQSLKSLMSAKIDPDKVLIYFGQILDGVEAAHLKGVIHRDLKPENVLFDKKNDNLMIADFGIAHFTEEEMKTLVETKPDTRLANFMYAAPEQKVSGGVVNKQADIYALGLMLNEMFTSQVPHGTNYKTIGSLYSQYAYLDELISSMIRQDSSQRQDSIEEIKKELIGRRKEFIHLQELSKLTGIVITTSEIDDPLVNDPPKLVDFDWDDGLLTLRLNRVVTPKWVNVFGKITGVNFFWGQGPSTLEFDGDTTYIGARENVIQQSINNFKEWLEVGNKDYVQFLKSEKLEEEEKLRQELHIKIEKADRRREALKDIKM